MRVLFLIALIAAVETAQAQHQQLVPSPYGSGEGANILVAPRSHRHQYLVPSPYGAGDGANIIVAPRARRHQYLVPSPYQRQLGPNALGNPRPYRIRKNQKFLKPVYPRQNR